jgi:hypothetical protein
MLKFPNEYSMVGADPKGGGAKPASAFGSHALDAAPPHQVHDQGNQEQHQENDEEDMRDAGRRPCNPAETKQTGDKSDNQKY